MDKPVELHKSPYLIMSRGEWAAQRRDTPMTLSPDDVARLGGLSARLSTKEVEEIYLPLSRLLSLYVSAAQELHMVTSRFLGKSEQKVPFIIGIAGSVACGKSTTARVMKALLARWPGHPHVDLISTDGFLLPNKVLNDRKIMHRKGFPESFDTARLLRFLADVKSGEPNVKAPIYSHFAYDILENQYVNIDRPDILIVEGLNVLQPARMPKSGSAIPFVSDFFDVSVYIDAATNDIEQWYIDRFWRLRETAFKDPAAFFHKYALLEEHEVTATARNIWRSINLRNLEKNILPTRQRADLILRKGRDHAVEEVKLRKL
jgi:type I pantothenate kinase